MVRGGEISVIQKVRFWPNPAIRVRKASFRTGKITYRIDRQLPTQSGLRTNNLLGELPGSPGWDRATGNSQRDSRYPQLYLLR